MLLGMTSGRGCDATVENSRTVVWGKASEKAQVVAIVQGATTLKLAPLAKVPKATLYEFRSAQQLPECRQSRASAPQVALSSPALAQCSWVGVIVLMI